ncbi:MAG: dodecin [Pseudomonadota bacterium]
MSDNVYKVIRLVGSSSSSIEEAIQNAIKKSSKTLKNLRWFKVIETRGHIENDKVDHFQVTLEVGFTLEN